VVAKRPGDTLDREPVEAVGGELELEVAVVGLAFELQAEAEQRLFERLGARLGVAGEPAQLVGVDVDDGHQ